MIFGAICNKVSDFYAFDSTMQAKKKNLIVELHESPHMHDPAGSQEHECSSIESDQLFATTLCGNFFAEFLEVDSLLNLRCVSSSLCAIFRPNLFRQSIISSQLAVEREIENLCKEGLLPIRDLSSPGKAQRIASHEEANLILSKGIS